MRATAKYSGARARVIRAVACAVAAATVVVAPMVAPTEAQAEDHRRGLLLADRFADGNDDGWTQHNRSWQVVDGRYVLNGGYVPQPCGRDGWSVTHAGDSAWTDYSVAVDIDATVSPWQEGELLFRTSDRTSAACLPIGYRLLVWIEYNPAEPRLQLFRYDEAGATTLAEVVGARRTHIAVGDASNHVRVDVRGGLIRVRVNGKTVIRHTDAHPIASGGVGLMGIWESTPAFDNVRVVRLGRDCAGPRSGTAGG